nr:PREDICTED: uncharacterized protein LOC108952385 isoform X3 [Musa acuminata subsp. malaccensis]
MTECLTLPLSQYVLNTCELVCYYYYIGRHLYVWDVLSLSNVLFWEESSPFPACFEGSEEEEEARREKEGARAKALGFPVTGMWAMSDEKPPAEICKGVNGFDKAVLREDNRRSAEGVAPVVGTWKPYRFKL